MTKSTKKFILATLIAMIFLIKCIFTITEGNLARLYEAVFIVNIIAAYLYANKD